MKARRCRVCHKQFYPKEKRRYYICPHCNLIGAKNKKYVYYDEAKEFKRRLNLK